MSFVWELRPVPLEFVLGDKLLFSVGMKLHTCSVGLMDFEPVACPTLCLHGNTPDGASGFYIHRLLIASEQPKMRWLPQHLCYIPAQDPRHYIDLRQSFKE